jgi:hypothetical protein
MLNDISDLRALSAAIGRRLPSRELDAEIHAVFCSDAAYAEALPAYTRDIDAAMRLVPPGWWFHFSHIKADVVPTTQIPGIPMSDSSDHGLDGRPVRYCSMTFGDRGMMALGICGAVVLASLALALKADARARGRLHLVQTGHGPMMAGADGRLAPLPYGFWVDDEGRLVPGPTPSMHSEKSGG